MVICPDCGKEVTDAKFCSNCGSRLPEDKKVEIPIEEDVVEEPVVDENVEEDVVDVEEIIDEPVEDVVEEPVIEEQVPEEVIEDKKSKFCPNCGTEVVEGTVFCPNCGSKLVQEEKQEEKPQTKFCQNCGKKIDINAEICPHCGVRVSGIKSYRTYEEKNVLLSAILSFLFPGLGHLYLGLTTKGISFIIAMIVSWALMFLLIGFILAPIVWLWALIDSIKSTEAINRGESVEDKLF